jgi:hypothetical protein
VLLRVACERMFWMLQHCRERSYWDGGGSGGAAVMKIAITTIMMVMLMMIDDRLTNKADCKV